MGVLTSQGMGIRRAKVVLLGAPGVGKTSLVARYVHSVFSEHHKSTLGVKVDRKTVQVGEQSVTMLIWDMHGEAEGLDVPPSYYSGAMAGLVVFDSVRPETIEVARSLGDRLIQSSPDAMIRLVANKSDLVDSSDAFTAEIDGAELHRTSAKSGDGVEELFVSVARSLT